MLREQYAHARQDGWKEDATIEYECNGKLLTKQTDKPKKANKKPKSNKESNNSATISSSSESNNSTTNSSSNNGNILAIPPNQNVQPHHSQYNPQQPYRHVHQDQEQLTPVQQHQQQLTHQALGQQLYTPRQLQYRQFNHSKANNHMLHFNHMLLDNYVKTIILMQNMNNRNSVHLNIFNSIILY